MYVHCDEVVIDISYDDAGTWMVQAIDKGEDDAYDETALVVSVLIESGVDIDILFGDLCVEVCLC